MVHDCITSLPVPDVLTRARAFFAERVPSNAAYPEEEGPGFLTLRGQGGEEVAISARSTPEGTRVRASTLFFDQGIGRFFSTLPAPGQGAA
jgi:hypothetical protein